MDGLMAGQTVHSGQSDHLARCTRTSLGVPIQLRSVIDAQNKLARFALIAQSLIT